ncbi:signal peptidase I [Akkermansiaceae bacterium]|nr:signal peptidase I [Akkermansiaceae bacterium]
MEENRAEPGKRRWPGLVLGFFVPGFGLFRAGLPLRAVVWLFGLILLNFMVAVSLAWAAVPVWFAVLGVVIMVCAHVWMLCDGFRPGSMGWRLWLLFIGLFAVLLVIPSPVAAVAGSFRVSTGAMEPTLRGSDSSTGADHVVVDCLSYRFAPPERGDLLVFSTADISGLHQFTGSAPGTVYIKRLVGMPGETIRIEDGKVFADGQPLMEADGIPPFVYRNPMGALPVAMKDGVDLVIGADEYFVLGDNTSNSLDSRYWGGVPKSSVLGKVTMIYHPFSRAGRLAED